MLLLMSFLPLACALLLHFPLLHALVTPFLLIIETATVRARSWTDTVIENFDGALAS